MSNEKPAKVADVLAQVSADNAEVRASVLALVQAMPQAIADAVKQALPVPTVRAPRTARVAVQMSPADADAAMCGFNKKGPRRDFFLAVRELPSGTYSLAETFPGVSLAEAGVVYRRLSGQRTGGRVTESFFERLGFEIAIVNEVRGKAEIGITRYTDANKTGETA